MEKNKGTKWTKAEHEVLAKYYKAMGYKCAIVVAEITGRSETAVRARIRKVMGHASNRVKKEDNTPPKEETYRPRVKRKGGVTCLQCKADPCFRDRDGRRVSATVLFDSNLAEEGCRLFTKK